MKEVFDKSNPAGCPLGWRAALGDAGRPARASMVNRTHRVVRERAKTMAARRSRFAACGFRWRSARRCW